MRKGVGKGSRGIGQPVASSSSNMSPWGIMTNPFKPIFANFRTFSAIKVSGRLWESLGEVSGGVWGISGGVSGRVPWGGGSLGGENIEKTLFVFVFGVGDLANMQKPEVFVGFWRLMCKNQRFFNTKWPRHPRRGSGIATTGPLPTPPEPLQPRAVWGMI